jgi:hypothetical protein
VGMPRSAYNTIVDMAAEQQGYVTQQGCAWRGHRRDHARADDRARHPGPHEPRRLPRAPHPGRAARSVHFASRRGAPAEHGPHATRFDVRLTYQTRAWATVRLEVSGPEYGADEAEYVDAISLRDFRLSGPQVIACLPLRFQIAQKLHAVSARPVGRANDRFRDLVDLLVLRHLIDDLPALRRACETTFASRATYAWPPPLEVPPTWWTGYARLVASETDSAGGSRAPRRRAGDGRTAPRLRSADAELPSLLETSTVPVGS